MRTTRRSVLGCALVVAVLALSIPRGGDAATFLLVSTGHVTINGAGQDDTILEGGGNDRVILVTGTAIATIADLTVRNGRADSGAGIRNDATLAHQGDRR